MRTTILAICLVLGVLSQNITPAPTASTESAKKTSLAAAPSVISLFLPMGSPDQVDASIISASPNQTAFALGCGKGATASECIWDPPITITEGESTVIWTNTQQGHEDVSATIPFAILECALIGAHTTESPILGASSAICTGRSTIDNLGVVASTSILASTEINYIPVTITAGLEKVAAASEQAATAVSGSSTSSAQAPARTKIAGAVLGGIAGLGIAILGVL